MKSIPKPKISLNFYYDARQKNKYSYETAHSVSLTFFSNFLSFDFRVFIFLCFVSRLTN